MKPGGAPGRAIRGAGAAAVVAGGFLLGPALEAQAPEEPLRSQRHLAVGNLSFLGTGTPLLQGGYLYQVSFRPSRVSTDEFGVVTVIPPRWYAHALVAAGWAGDSDGTGRSGPAGTGQLGALYRFDGPASISRVGLAAQGSVAPRGIGPVVRVGFLYGNAALSVGWMAFERPRSEGVVVSLDVLRCLLQDLGLVGSCLIP